MKIGIIGGTGRMGKGLALRWVLAGHRVTIGSRSLDKANNTVDEIIRRLGNDYRNMLHADTYQRTVADNELIVLSIPYFALKQTLDTIRNYINMNKIILSPIVPLVFKDGKPVLIKNEDLSVAEEVARYLNNENVVSGFHTLPYRRLLRYRKEIQGDIVVFSDNKEAKKTVMDLVKDIPSLRPLDGGGLENSGIIERFTYLLLEVRRINKLGDVTIYFRK
ncbi:MAG: NADPH-dependent F420 reductase [Thermoproteales archaeon]|nr:NADPH-dependent F420 reductase [Thermoproteales archaeon]